MIKGNDLTNRAEGMEPEGAAKFHEDYDRMRGKKVKADQAKAEVPSLADRIESAKGLTAGLADCRACYHLGRDLVVGLLSSQGDDRSLADRLAEASALRTPHEHGGDPAFVHGRDAAIRTIAGEG